MPNNYIIPIISLHVPYCRVVSLDNTGISENSSVRYRPSGIKSVLNRPVGTESFLNFSGVYRLLTI